MLERGTTGTRSRDRNKRRLPIFPPRSSGNGFDGRVAAERLAGSGRVWSALVVAAVMEDDEGQRDERFGL